ncbi:MAG: hypothetical protein AMS21_00225 [Gemmatimonas sp. SG8_38_2]|nr:MAG: hypothetical protein AMS21_00225 [Gemmatimonas sp. SG8_38_2]
MTGSVFPSRYQNRARARFLFGPDADRYAALYLQSDPIVDELAQWLSENGAPARRELERALRSGGAVSQSSSALRRFFERAAEVPAWADFDEIDLGARAYQRFGVMGMIVLSAWSLINGYHSSAAVKPLAFTGQLRHNTQRRLAETARFVSEASQVGGLRPGKQGWEISLRVSVIHAHVRSACLASPQWRTEDWGVPINQADMFGTLLEFSLLVLDGALRLGFVVTKEERRAILAMWRCCGHLSGVDPWLLAQLADEEKTRRIADLIRLIQPGPDEDSLALTRQILKVPGKHPKGTAPSAFAVAVSRFHNGLARALNGPEIADDLGIPNDLWKYSIYPARAIIGPLERVRRAVPGATQLASYLGNQVVRRDLARILGGTEPTFSAP